ILAHVAPYGVIQVSDRLLTEHGTARQFDAHSNKALLYLCTDAIVAIGYTGIAYIGDSPADVWIANQLVGTPLQEHQTFGKPMRVERRNIVSAAEMLRTQLEAEIRRARMQQFEVLLAGWKWTRRRKLKRPEPFVALLYWAGDRMITKTLPRYWWYERGRDEVLIPIPASNMGYARAEQVMKSVTQCADDVSMRNVLVETVRSMSTENATVGADCMSIMLPPPQLCRAEIEFIVGSSDSPYGEVYSPWVITPGYVHKPSILFGGWEIHDGPWTIYLKDVVRGFAAWAKQPRPRRPR
ncbi:MAG: hypothetical protein WAN65_04655, partial [Candidatus Sulfotelmatobacter sp.]